MATNKTTKTENSVPDFINTVEDSIKRSDSFKLLEIFHEAGFEPKCGVEYYRIRKLSL